MMKLVLMLVVLFYGCYSAPAMPAKRNLNLNTQMITTMERLNGNVTLPLGFRFYRPTRQMHRNASFCLAPFINKLKELLDNVIVPANRIDLFDELMANLKELEHKQENIQNQMPNCKMNDTGNTSLPFTQFIVFLKKLNNTNIK